MIGMRLFLDADGMLNDVPADKIIVADQFIKLGVLSGGMAGGKPSVSFGIYLPDGHVVLAETSLLLLQSAVHAFTARYGDLTQEPQ